MMRILVASAIVCWGAQLVAACPCCPTCSMETCPCFQPGTAPPTTPEPKVAKVCNAFSCPTGSVLRENAASLTGESAEACCLKTCSAFTCPAGKVKRQNAATITTDNAANFEDACCLAVCSAFTCPAGAKMRKGAATITGNDATACCLKEKCDIFSCPAGDVLRTGADSMEGYDAATCCEAAPPVPKLCTGFTCPADMMLRDNAASIEGEDAAACCLQTCTKFSCPESMILRDGAKLITVVDGDATACCLPTCAGFTCPAGKVVRDEASSITGSDEATCCMQTCSGFTCPIGSILRANEATVTGFDETTCCLKTCSGFTCAAGMSLRADAASFTGFDEATCCSQTCTGFACPTGMMILASAAGIVGSDEATCCFKTCAGFTCPAGHALKTDAAGKAGSDVGTCCEKSGPMLQCNLNCFGESATPVPLPGGNGNGIPAGSIEMCRDFCMGTDGCEAIVFGQGMCYGKKDIRTSKCQPSDGSFKTEVLTRMPYGTCIIMGDPHVLTFDNPLGTIGDITQLTAGDYVMVESDLLTIHGRFGYCDRFPGEASLTGLSITGSIMKNQKLDFEFKGPDKGPSGFTATWNGAQILTAFPCDFTSDDGLVKGAKANINPDEVHRQARHTIGGDVGSGDMPSFKFEIAPDITIYAILGDQTMNAVITMRKPSGEVDGYCGNFNCMAADDTLEELGKRGLAAPIAKSVFQGAAPEGQATASGTPKTLNDCSPTLLAQAQENCKGAEDAMMQDCMFDVCASGSAEAGKEDAMTAGIGEAMEAKFSFMGLALPKLANVGISPQMQWMLVFVTMSFAAGGFVSGAWSRRGRGRTAGFVHLSTEDEEEALLMPPAWEHEPLNQHDGDSELEA